MQFLLTERELFQAIQEAALRDDGLMEFSLPANRLLEEASNKSVLTFSELDRTVHCGRLKASLSLTQFELLRYVYTHGKTDFEELQDAVWRKDDVSNDAIRRVISKLNTELLEGGFPVEISHSRSRASLEQIG